METEFEAKFYPVNKKKIRIRLENIGAKLVKQERKMRRAIFGGEDNKGLKCDYIRIRDEGGFIRLSAKKHANDGGKIGDQKETDVEISNYENAIQILEMTGLKVSRYQENLRESWSLGGAAIEIDTWPSLQPWVEVEADNEDAVREVFGKLGLDWERKIITSAVEIYAKVFALTNKKVLSMLKNLTFENDPFKKLRKVDTNG